MSAAADATATATATTTTATTTTIMITSRILYVVPVLNKHQKTHSSIRNKSLHFAEINCQTQ